ncbi:DUF3693 domain-containing protein [Vibrio parahaemolyticus]
MSKKFDRLGLPSISITCAELTLVIASPQEPLYQCALWVSVMLSGSPLA